MKISIVTPVLNAVNTIERTILSVLSQRMPELEYIIIDGGSTDGTFEVINRYKKELYYFQSRPDAGLYDAMNQGIARASGDIIGIINADDYYLPGALEKVCARLENENFENSILWGDVQYQFAGRVKGFRRKNLYIGAFAPHPSMFVPRRIYERIGVYNLRYKFLADYDFMYRAINCHGINPVYLPELLAFFSEGGLADTHVKECLREELLVKIHYGQFQPLAKLIYFFKLLKNFRRIRR